MTTEPDPTGRLREVLAFANTYDEDGHPHASNELKQRLAALAAPAPDLLAAVEALLDRLVEEYGDDAMSTTSRHNIAEWLADLLPDALRSLSTTREADR